MAKAQRLKEEGGGNEEVSGPISWKPAKVQTPRATVNQQTILFCLHFCFFLRAMMHISFPLLFSLWFNYKKRKNLSIKEELLFPSSATSARSWI